MGKSTKKSASKAGAAPTKPSKKGKREAEVIISNDNRKKRKRDLVEENDSGAKTTKTFIKEKDDNTMDEQELKEDSCVVSSDQVKVSAEIDSIDSNPILEDESGAVKTDASAPKETIATENDHIDESGNDRPKEEIEDGSGKEEIFEKEESSKMQEVEKSVTVPEENSSSEELSTEEDIAASSEEAETEMDVTPKEESAGSKVLFVGNLSFSVEQADVEKFFKAAGEIVHVRLAMGADCSFRGFGHVEFATPEGAVKALNGLNGKDLVGRPVRLDLAKERGSHTTSSGEKEKSFQKDGSAPRQTIFVRGFNKDDGEDQIRSALEDYFGSCGEITRVSIPREQDGGVRGIAYIDFKDYAAYNRALEFNGSKFRENTLIVEAANPRDVDFDNGRRGGWSGGRGSGGRFNGHQRGARARRGRFNSGGVRGCGRPTPQAKPGGS